MMMLAALAECAIAAGWLAGDLAASVSIAAHVFIIAAMHFCWGGVAAKSGEDIRPPLLAIVSTAALGPIGALGSLATWALTRHYMRRATPFEEWYRSLFPDAQEREEFDLADRIAAAGTIESEAIAAFADVLSFGSLGQKRDLIAVMSRQFRPAFGPILKRALNDGHSAIRVQAATAMSKLENRILDRTLELTGKVRANPASTEMLRELAQHYDECLFSGILDARREEELSLEALSVYRECLNREPGDVATRLAAGRLLLRNKNFRESAEYFGHAANADPTKPEAALWYMESLFQLSRFDEIRGLARDWVSRQIRGEYPPEALEAVRLWADMPESGRPVPVGSF